MIKDFSMVKKTGWLFGLVLSFVSILTANATHLRAGEITIERSGPFSRTLIITITVYTNTSGANPVLFGGDGILSFGDGNTMDIPTVANDPRPDLGENIGIASITVTHIYGTIGEYIISYVEPNRNGDVNNMDNSLFTMFYLETKFNMAVQGGNFSPKLRIPPIDQACSGVAFFHNPGAYDTDLTDSLSYEMVIPFRDRGLPVVNYRDPNNPAFYAGVPFSNEDGDGPPTFSINRVNGQLLWDAPGISGEYNIAFHVNEWRKVNGVWTLIGYVRRDMQIIVNGDCSNERPLIETPQDTCVVAGANLNKIITGSDPNNTPSHPVKIEAFSEIFTFNNSPATYSPVPGPDDYRTPPALTTFDWNTTCAHIKGQPYQVIFKITDKPDLGPKLVTQQAWQITVIAPAPVLNTATVQIPERFVDLQWDPYECAATNDPAARIQVWRRVDATSYVPGNCDTGMPEGLGFSLIATVPITSVGYEDTNNNRGLDRGVKYCYRLVAIFPSRGAESYVSNEQCIDPMEIAAPLITKVTVDKTSETDGEITVSWIPPLNPEDDLDDYEYQLERATATGFISVSPKMTDATLTFTDASSLNTLNEQYTYRVMLYLIGNNTPVDSSTLASSVWLDLTTANGEINLSWSANVPWSNQIQGVPHDIYRGPEGASTLADLTLLTTVNVTEDGLRYTDDGEPAFPLETTQVYCYLVVARGSYGNPDPAVPTPLVNLSQINCAKPIDPIPPCAPVIALFSDPCETYFNKYNCSSSLFDVTVSWSVECKEDIRGYYLYSAPRENGNYTPIKNEDGTKKLIRDTFEVVQNYTLDYCYRIESVDRSGNVSAMSDPVCSSGCPNFELPNVFTPNGDFCNDKFSAYGVLLAADENPVGCDLPQTNDPRCARSVKRVDFKVFNRWGRRIYDYVGERGNENSIYINWDGRDNSGKEVASGIYYYSADVTFDSTKPGGTVKTFKGWVHLAR
jgi:CHU_C Type IX secretion signal domain